jgi:large subunit ribosomal protein L3
MPAAILGKKIGMTRVFSDTGAVVPVTVIQAGPCPVLRARTKEQDGYEAVQIGFEKTVERKLSKPMRGVFQSLGTDLYRVISEIRMDGEPLPEAGTVLTVAAFSVGDLVNVRGRTRGHGFSGSHKRHGFKGGPAAHGSKFHRAPGSVGTNTTPGRTGKGRKLPGQFGNKFRTVRHLQVVKVIPEENLIFLRGAVPGAPGALLKIVKV